MDLGTCSIEPEGQQEAESLAAAIAHGWPLPTLSGPVPLPAGEVIHAQLDARGWRFNGMDVAYEQRRVFAAGVVTFGVAAVLTSIGNRRARRRAEQMAAPQWRPLERMPVLVTNQWS